MTHHLEALDLVCLVFANAAFLQCDGKLGLHAVDAVKIWQEQPASAAARDDDAVGFRIEGCWRIDWLRRAQHVNTVFQLIELIRTNGRKAWIAGAGGNGILHDLPGEVVAGWCDGADAAAQPAVFV